MRSAEPVRIGQGEHLFELDSGWARQLDALSLEFPRFRGQGLIRRLVLQV